MTSEKSKFEEMTTEAQMRNDEYCISRATGCWLWLGQISGAGYGRKGLGKQKRIAAHRYAYESLVGSIPEGLVLDHLCRNKLCVNPKHLDPVPNKENLIRGDNVNRRKVVCAKGHAYDDKNTYTRMQGAWKMRSCKICKNEWVRNYKRKKRAEAKLPHIVKNEGESVGAQIRRVDGSTPSSPTTGVVNVRE